MDTWFEQIQKGKKDACYHKVRSRYKKWPSAYASGALVQCRKVGAKNWGNSKKKKSVKKGGDNFKREKDEGLHGWFSRRGGKEKGGKTQGGWIDCSSCGSKDGPREDVGQHVQHVKHIKEGREQHDLV
jgi:hypothetical protein